jgi:hypothetical protein
MTPRFPRLCAAAFIIICVAWPFSTPVEAQGKKGKSVSRSKGKSARSSRRSARRGKSRRRYASNRISEEDLVITPANYPVVPDRIEVLEYGSPESSDLGRRSNPSASRSQTSTNSSEAELAAIAPRRRVKIEPSRALEIQQALTNRGFYIGEMTGVYDAATVDAMRRFQASQRIAVTGYPTAHSLKRLGLAN